MGMTKTTSGFGGITRGVIEAASMGGKRRAPVMRLEELHQVPSQQSGCHPSAPTPHKHRQKWGKAIIHGLLYMSL